MKEAKSNIPKKQPEEKGFGGSLKSNFIDREKLNNELREAIDQITGRRRINIKNNKPTLE